MGLVYWILFLKNTSSVQLDVQPLSKDFILYLAIRTLSPTLNFGFDDYGSISPYKLKQTIPSFSFLDASMGVIFIELCLVLLYCFNI